MTVIPNRRISIMAAFTSLVQLRRIRAVAGVKVPDFFDTVIDPENTWLMAISIADRVEDTLATKSRRACTVSLPIDCHPEPAAISGSSSVYTDNATVDKDMSCVVNYKHQEAESIYTYSLFASKSRTESNN